MRLFLVIWLLVTARKLLLLVRLIARRSHRQGVLCRQSLLQASSLIRELAKESFHVIYILDLGPHEVDLVHLILVMLDPPVTIFEQ